jgi:hypothetical protein
MSRTNAPPYTRVGLCCGCHRLEDLPLYRVGNLYRYRCLECFIKETGHKP